MKFCLITRMYCAHRPMNPSLTLPMVKFCRKNRSRIVQNFKKPLEMLAQKRPSPHVDVESAKIEEFSEKFAFVSMVSVCRGAIPCACAWIRLPTTPVQREMARSVGDVLHNQLQHHRRRRHLPPAPALHLLHHQTKNRKQMPPMTKYHCKSLKPTM